jgi:plastocyanin
MYNWWRTGALLALLGVLSLGCGNGSSRDSPEPTSPPAERPAVKPEPRQVFIDNFTYDPPTLTVAPGTRVTWVNRDDVPHTVTSAEKPRTFDSGALDTDMRFSHTFTTSGTYEYFCAVHPKMTARIIVK